MACKKCQKKLNKTPIGDKTLLFYFYCPICDELKANRMPEVKSIGYKCPKCGGKTLKFQKPPSMHKLRGLRVQRFRMES